LRLKLLNNKSLITASIIELLRVKIIHTGGTLAAHIGTLALEFVYSSIFNVVLGLGCLGIRVTRLLGLQFGLLEGVHALDLVDSLSS
jgi:hypothetical protein